MQRANAPTDYASSCAGSEFRESGGQHCERTEGGRGTGAEKTAPERRSARQRTHISETRGLGGGRSPTYTRPSQRPQPFNPGPRYSSKVSGSAARSAPIRSHRTTSAVPRSLQGVRRRPPSASSAPPVFGFSLGAHTPCSSPIRPHRGAKAILYASQRSKYQKLFYSFYRLEKTELFFGRFFQADNLSFD